MAVEGESDLKIAPCDVRVKRQEMSKRSAVSVR